MSKLIKFIIFIVVLIVIVLGVMSYFDIGSPSAIESAIKGECKPFRTEVDAGSKANIDEIISTMANTSTLGLAFKSNHLHKLGDEVDKKVPSPLVFLYVIFSDQKLANYMKEIKTSSFKYNNFIEGLYENMMKSYKHPECFKKNVMAFAKALKINPDKTYAVAKTCGRKGESGDKSAFRPFVDYLIEQKARK